MIPKATQAPSVAEAQREGMSDAKVMQFVFEKISWWND
jgi:hypothetical protein